MLLRIDQIELDGGTQTRAEIDYSVVEDYAALLVEGVRMPAVVVFYDGAAYWLADGFHRTYAATRADMDAIEVEVKQGSRRDAVLFSVAANSAHGLRRTNADKRRAVETLLCDPEWSQWSNREIARRCGVADTLVGDVRQTVSAVEPQIERTVERNGSIYQMRIEPRLRPVPPIVPPGTTTTVYERGGPVTYHGPQDELMASPMVPWSEISPNARKDQSETCILPVWRSLDDDQRTVVMATPRSRTSTFNKQASDSIEWAQWSWNPVTGCLHNCSYCYARDIAERFYPQKFVPAFLPERLDAPRNTAVPAEAATNIGYKNVFTCSMADLFGKWVPAEWIKAVLDAARQNPQWNSLFLTKFPRRLAEFEFPDNAWVGTSVDAQSRVKNAEDAMRNVRASVKWYSCEPMLEPLEFTDLSLVNWIVIGGASRSTETPEFRPPRAWVNRLEAQAHAAGCYVYEKTNLLQRIREYPGQDDAPAVDVPAAFKMGYLKRDVIQPEEYDREVG